MSVSQLLQSLFSLSHSKRRKLSLQPVGPLSVELLESRTLLTLIGMTATVSNTLQSDAQTGGNEVSVGTPASSVVSEGTADPEFASFAGIYDIDIDASSISMTFNLTTASDPSGIVSAGTFDRYYFTFDLASNETVSSAVADPTATLVPNVRIQGRDTIVVEVAPGMRVGNGFDALINVQVARTGTVITGRKFHDFNNDSAFNSGESWLNGWDVNLIDINQNSTVIATTTTADIDLNGDGEIDPASERGVYEFSNLPASTYLLQEVERPGWAISLPTTPEIRAAFELNQDIDLQPAGSSFLNWGGLQEKWLFGSGSWYFMTPNGSLSKWDGSPSDNLTGTAAVQLNADFYNDLSKLYNAPSPRQYIVDIDGATNATHRGLDFGNYLVPPNSSLAQNSDNTVTLTWEAVVGHTYDVWITDINTGRRHEVTEGVTGPTFTSGVLPDRRYRVWMRTQTSDAIYSPWSVSQVFEFTRNAIDTPITNGLNAGIDATPTLIIAPQTGATNYDVRVTNSSRNVIYQASGGATHRVASELRLGTYTVSVRANFADGSRTAWSAEQTLTVDGRPVVTIANGQFTWASVTAATHYEIWIDRIDAAGNQLQRRVVYIDDLQETSFSTTGLPRGNYALWVRAIRAESGIEHVSFWSTQTDFLVSSISEDDHEASPLADGLQLSMLTTRVDTESETELPPPKADVTAPLPPAPTSAEEIVIAVMEELAGSDMLDQSPV